MEDVCSEEEEGSSDAQSFDHGNTENEVMSPEEKTMRKCNHGEGASDASTQESLPKETEQDEVASPNFNGIDKCTISSKKENPPQQESVSNLVQKFENCSDKQRRQVSPYPCEETNRPKSDRISGVANTKQTQLWSTAVSPLYKAQEDTSSKDVLAVENKPSITLLSKTARIIASATTVLQNEIVVVNCDDIVLTSPELAEAFFDDIAVLQMLGLKMVIVHGGESQADKWLHAKNVESKFKNANRVYTPEMIEITEMATSGEVNKQVSSGICGAGGMSIGMSGRDANLLQCKKGELEKVNAAILLMLLNNGVCPAIASVGCGMVGEEQRGVYLVDADVTTRTIAEKLHAVRIIFLTDIEGASDNRKNGNHFIDGKVPHALLNCILVS